MTTEQAANYLMIFLLIVFLTIGLLSMLVGWIVARWDAFRGWWGIGVQKAIHYRPIPKADESERTRSSDFSLPAAIEPQSEPERTGSELYLNPAEVIALHRMIEHNKTAAKPSKSSTIQAGFGVSRGGSSAYARASLIYDALFGAPAPAITYRERTSAQEELRKQLKLN